MNIKPWIFKFLHHTKMEAALDGRLSEVFLSQQK